MRPTRMGRATPGRIASAGESGGAPGDRGAAHSSGACEGDGRVTHRIDASRFDAACDPATLWPGLERGLERAWGEPVELVDLEVPRAFPREQGGITLGLRARARC